MHESMSITSGDEWSPDRRESNIEAALVRLDEALNKAHKIASDLVGRLEIVLQPEEPSEMKEGSSLTAFPASTTVRRLDEQTEAADRLARRLRGVMDRLDT